MSTKDANHWGAYLDSYYVAIAIVVWAFYMQFYCYRLSHTVNPSPYI